MSGFWDDEPRSRLLIFGVQDAPRALNRALGRNMTNRIEVIEIEARRRRSPASRIAGWAVTGLTALLSAQGCLGNGHKECTSTLPSDSCGRNVPDACRMADGCTVGPSCVQVSCSTIATMPDCKAISTCTWLAGSEVCVFASEDNPCEGATEVQCKANNACSWQTTCNGQIKSCQGLNEAQCAAIPHCYMETVPDLN